MGHWAAASPTTKHGEHRYDLASYGVGEHEIRAAFAEYMKTHHLN
jgi:hypothetical protein